jgi:hypothetical protein
MCDRGKALYERDLHTLDRIGNGKRRLDRKSFSVNLYYESRTLADFCDLYDFGRLLTIWLGFTLEFPGDAELKLVLSQV